MSVNTCGVITSSGKLSKELIHFLGASISSSAFLARDQTILRSVVTSRPERDIRIL